MKRSERARYGTGWRMCVGRLLCRRRASHDTWINEPNFKPANRQASQTSPLGRNDQAIAKVKIFLTKQRLVPAIPLARLEVLTQTTDASLNIGDFMES